MTNFSMEFPNGFEEYAWEIEAKGWLPGVVVLVDGRRYSLTFYDPSRLSQDVDEEIIKGRPFFEPNLIVVSTVTRVTVEAAVCGIVAAGRYENWAAEEVARAPEKSQS